MPAAPRVYREFVHREARFRICCAQFEAVTAAIIALRETLGDYLARHPHIQPAFVPVEMPPDAPPIAQRLHAAATATGVGPMAAVAGAVAQAAAEAGIAAGADEAIVENGGDIYLQLSAPATIGLYAGDADIGAALAFVVEVDQTPLAICSSSGAMGHSTSLGQCDLATVVASDAALADAAATDAANRVAATSDIDAALARLARIDGLQGALIAQGDRVGTIGTLPRLVRQIPPSA
ncbi:MAG: UPF0280 family protein [Verrucomicrobia bacterium]|jgi:uncharacterized protein|nr:UPF0280 family protein [Verrucomicrobiota bacterium]MBT7066515.1 UPF0280 family protein [Verrucomicrobiota bacterium]MBT7699148.1 UPF0280 family protein [Verrucomicrobiota bacterium]